MKPEEEDPLLLPEDVLTEILARLPIKSLIRLSCLCKSWRDLILKNPYFGEKHLNSEQDDDPTIANLIFTDEYDLFITHNSHRESSSLVVSRIPDLRDYLIDRELASCNGILCSANRRGHGPIYLFNPLTRQHPLKIPGFDAAVKYRYQLHGLGFGFGAISKDYKVVMIGDSFSKTDGRKNYVHVYNLSTNSWSNLDDLSTNSWSNLDVKLEQHYDSYWRGLYAKGCYYWLVVHGSQYYEPKIFKFDFENDTFREIEFPELAVHDDECMSVVDDSLAICFTTDCSGHQVGVWVMGKEETWMKKFSVTLPNNISMVKSFWIHDMNLVILGYDRSGKISVIATFRNERLCKTFVSETIIVNFWRAVCSFRPTLVSPSQLII